MLIFFALLFWLSKSTQLDEKKGFVKVKGIITQIKFGFDHNGIMRYPVIKFKNKQGTDIEHPLKHASISMLSKRKGVIVNVYYNPNNPLDFYITEA